jgi:hypothetical protein
VRVRDLESGKVRDLDWNVASARTAWRGTRAREGRSLSEAFVRARADRIAIVSGSPVAPELIRHFEQRGRRR